MNYRRANTHSDSNPRPTEPLAIIQCMNFLFQPWAPVPTKAGRKTRAGQERITRVEARLSKLVADCATPDKSQFSDPHFVRVMTSTTMMDSLIGGESMDEEIVKPHMSGLLCETLVAVSLSKADLARTA